MSSFTVSRREWHDAVTAAAVCCSSHLSDPDAWPQLPEGYLGVRVQIDTDGTGTCWGTDQFIAGRSTVRVKDYLGPALDFILTPEAIATLGRVFPATPGRLTFSVVPGDEHGLIAGDETTHVRLPAVTTSPNYPDFDRMLATFDGDPNPSMAIAFDLRLIARFLDIPGQQRITITMPSEPRKPALVQIGGDFIGLVMPRRPGAQ